MKMPPIAEFKLPCTPRTDMPQIDEADLLDLITFLTRDNVPVSTCIKATADLVFHQHVYPERMPPSDSPDMNKPLLISADGYILDGNHRAAAHRRDGTRPVCIQLTAGFIEAMKALFAFPKTYVYERN